MMFRCLLVPFVALELTTADCERGEQGDEPPRAQPPRIDESGTDRS
jgi:hypothetical protein